MEKMLLKLARQLDSLDEASLMALWSKYATQTSRFEPTKRWEEACLVFSLIQAKHWKNQLFNYSWQQKRMPPVKDTESINLPKPSVFQMEDATNGAEKNGDKCKILSFSQSEENDNITSQD